MISQQTLLSDHLNEEYVLGRLKPVLENPAIRKSGFYLKETMIVLRRFGIRLQNAEGDPMLMKVEAPTTISGAVSPMARETARMLPVRIPGRAFGKT
jgi:hypothetical protein